MKIITLALGLLLASPLVQAGDVQIRKIAVKSGDVDVPAEVAIPAGKGPFPPVLYIH
ncbi:MAG: dienelactone hydrolase, partial [Nitrosomonadales bacterium]